ASLPVVHAAPALRALRGNLFYLAALCVPRADGVAHPRVSAPALVSRHVRRHGPRRRAAVRCGPIGRCACGGRRGPLALAPGSTSRSAKNELAGVFCRAFAPQQNTPDAETHPGLANKAAAIARN